MQNITETDVVGRCDTQYSVTQSAWGKTQYRKVKDMRSCTGNQALYQYALNLPDINIQHLPLLQSSHSCEVRRQDSFRREQVHDGRCRCLRAACWSRSAGSCTSSSPSVTGRPGR